MNKESQRAAVQIARAILGAKPDLSDTLQRLITPDVAWFLSIVILSFRGTAGEGIELSKNLDHALDPYAGSLLRFREEARSAKTAAELAGASALFQSAVNQIGSFALSYMLRSKRFAELETQVLSSNPAPDNLEQNGQSRSPSASKTRARRFDGFDSPSRRADEPQDPTATASQDDIERWKKDLQSGNTPPEKRWLLEQKLLAAGEYAYPSAAAARSSWQAAIKQTGSDGLRNYFAQNLKNLDGGGSA